MTNVISTETNRIPSLLPCPFCGGEAAVFTYNNEEYDVKCRNPYCLAKSSRWDTEAEAVEAWNTRAKRTCKKLPQLTDSVCIVRRGGMEAVFGYWRCSECGVENFEGAKYCMGCGAQVVVE